MRIIFICFTALIFISFCGCKKNSVFKSSSSSQTSDLISLEDCSQEIHGNDVVRICFEYVVEDSRCPRQVECVWEGTAVAKFSFAVNNDQHDITLSTVNLSPVFPSDTVLSGYKIQFIDLLPYPDTFNDPTATGYQAEVKITKQ